jgi:Domain of unknown function (DUF4833)
VKTLKKPLVALTLLFIFAAAALAQSSHLLFVLERNTNSNSVYYEARIGSDSLFEAKQPIHAYWIMWEKDPTGKTHEELTFLENEKAYGVKVKLSPTRKCVWFSIAPLPNRPIKVSLSGETPVAETVIDSQFCVLEKVRINATKKQLLPHVNYIDLFGRNPKTGEEHYERIASK